jgi:DnaJ-class molecular chaperone
MTNHDLMERRKRRAEQIGVQIRGTTNGEMRVSMQGCARCGGTGKIELACPACSGDDDTGDEASS